jgi:MOSC domain-containing protein YiiM
MRGDGSTAGSVSAELGPRQPLLGIVSVNAGTPSRLGVRSNGSVVYSAIAKRPVLGDTVWLDWQNLSGDRQGDMRVHGGVDKAVYCYAASHFTAWSRELGREFGPASFGENLTLDGAVESSVCIGDVWRWGDAVVQVAQPRFPCFKLTMHTGVPDMEQRFVASGRCGWYLRVLRPGEVPTHGSITLDHRDPAGLSVLDAHWAFSSDAAADVARIQPLLEVDALAESWKRMLRRRVRIIENRAS